MRLSLGLVLLGGILGSADAAQEFPYKAYVNREDVYVRSGPGEDYYPTDKMKIGQEVEIYRHDPGGWYAVRPPEGSFTWVSGRYLDVKKDRLAVVNGDRVASRVGSRFSDIRDVIQVRLQKGETVEILDEVTTSEGRGEKTTWYKIAPPAGEFRWVFGKYVDREYPHDGIRRGRGERTANVGPAEPPPVSRREERREEMVRREEIREAVADRRLLVATPVSTRPVPPPADIRPPAVAIVPPPDEQAPPVAQRSMRHTSPEEYQRELEDIDLKLSIMLAEEVSVWTFEELGPRAATMVEQAQTAVERGRARLLLNKIARFDEIKRRSDAVNNLRHDVDHRNAELVQLERQRAETMPTDHPDERFDGIGRLTRVAAPSAAGPRYALLEPNGQVRCYVTPAPGISLQHYVGREVGVNGVRGYIPDQQAAHVMAKHVTVLDDGSYVR